MSGSASRRGHRGLRSRAAVAAVVALGLVSAACSGDYDRLTTSTTTTRPTTTTTARPTTTTAPPPASSTTTPPGATTVPGPTTTTIPGSPAGLPGRLAVVALDGSLLTMRPDGTDPRVLAEGSAGSSVVSPTWSTDASRLVWTALATNSVRVRAANADGSGLRDAALSPQATAFLWNRSSTSLAALRAVSTTSVELDTLDLTTLAATALRTGAPLSASWSPDGTRLLVRAGTEELSVVRTTGVATPLALRAGSFGAPQWLDDTTALVGVRDGASQFLSLVDTNTGARRDLVSYTGSIRFQLNPAGTQVAYQVLPDAGGGSSSNVVFPQTTAPATVPQAAQNQLAVIDLASRVVTTVRSTPTAAFVWSPNSARLAYLTAEANDAYRWHFWSTQNTIDGATYVPTRDFLRTSVGLFDQLAQSVRWWSPDGAAFVYAGRAGARTGIWVQQAQPGVAPVFVAQGDSAVWSPA